jgi:anaerobic magnesium-protoporphyrin IX monomethyl ester cyclase
MKKSLPIFGTSAPAPALPVAPKPQRALLLGPIQQENLALQYLAAAVRRAGHSASVVAYSYRSDVDAALRAVLDEQPDLVGLGIAFQNNIDDYLLLLRALRERGYRGHVTAGGHVPTFCYRELLRDVPGLDTVVRHDGEETLVEVLHRLARGEVPRDIAGLVWRDGAEIAVGPVRHAAGELDALAWPARSPTPYTVGGFVVDFVITARGCVGECNYCSIAAYTSEHPKRYRLRKPEAVADEIAAQYRERGARVLFVQDDLFVLPSEKRSVERIERLTRALAERDVRDVVFWVKGRPETVTPAVATALREMGTIHLFLGVESASAERLSYLGRTHLPHQNVSALAACRAADIVPSFNFMLFDPDSSIEDLAVTLDLAEANPDLPWNVCRTEIYSGTALRDRLEAEGRLRGDYRSYGYQMLDPRAEVLFRILRVSLHERALAIESLLNRLISLSFARQLHEHFFPGPESERLAVRSNAIGVEARLDTVRVLREALAFVAGTDVHDAEKVRRFAIDQAFRVNAADRERRRQTEELWQYLHLRGRTLLQRRGLASASRDRGDFRVAVGS